jgi:hypothetical protein
VHLLEISLPIPFSLRRNSIGENREKEKKNGHVKDRRKKEEDKEK